MIRTISVLLAILLSTSSRFCSCHRMERLLDSDNDIGPMERPDYFERVYVRGRDLGYYGVGRPWTQSVPVPKVVIRRVHAPQDAGGFRAASGSLAQRVRQRLLRPFFGLSPGPLPLDLIPNVGVKSQGMMAGNMMTATGGGISLTRRGQPWYGVNYHWNGQTAGDSKAVGSGSIDEDVDQAGVTLSPDRANGW